ncbi:MAG: substrate-binding domain-containing protein [Pseudomonadota bacterium]
MSRLPMKVRIVIMMFVITGLMVSPVFSENPVLLMATTTSTDNTGLLDYLSPYFTEQTGIELKWMAVGTGKALEFGKQCDVDVLLVHAPDAEMQYVKNGYGVNRREIMFNDFLIIGPDSDPAGIKGKTTLNALREIAAKKMAFISRGDNSGTNKMEISLWKESGLGMPDKESWYVQTGQGMLASIAIAAERNGYTLTDRGTYIKYEANMGGSPLLKIVVQGDRALINQYSVIAINQSNCPKAGYDLAMKFSDWMASRETQNLIQRFTLLGKPLFTPNAR